MASMTLKQIPGPLLKRLRAQAKRERRSVNQHAIHLLEVAVRGAERRPSFGEAIARIGWRPEGLDGTEFDVHPTTPILPFDAAAADWHARERAHLVRRGLTPSFGDGQIAATAAVHKLTLVTRNTKDFAAYRGLMVENWFS